MDWVPIVFATFKALALGAAMYYAIKWHYDQGEKGARLTMLRSGAMMTGVFVVALVTVGVIAVAVSRTLGLDLRMP